MRRQYHSLLENGKFLVWDVHRLVVLTCDYPVQQISLSTIRELDEDFWFGSKLATCRTVAGHAKLIQETDLRFPIILSASGLVMVGMHRVCKALMLNQSTIRGSICDRP